MNATLGESLKWRSKSLASNRSITASSLIGIAITWVVLPTLAKLIPIKNLLRSRFAADTRR